MSKFSLYTHDFIYSHQSLKSVNASKIPSCFHHFLFWAASRGSQSFPVIRFIDKVPMVRSGPTSSQGSQSSLVRYLLQVWHRHRCRRPGRASAGTLQRVGTGRPVEGLGGRRPSASWASQTAYWPQTVRPRPVGRPSPGFYLRAGKKREVSLCCFFWELKPRKIRFEKFWWFFSLNWDRNSLFTEFYRRWRRTRSPGRPEEGPRSQGMEARWGQTCCHGNRWWAGGRVWPSRTGRWPLRRHHLHRGRD